MTSIWYCDNNDDRAPQRPKRKRDHIETSTLPLYHDEEDMSDPPSLEPYTLQECHPCVAVSHHDGPKGNITEENDERALLVRLHNMITLNQQGIEALLRDEIHQATTLFRSASRVFSKLLGHLREEEDSAPQVGKSSSRSLQELLGRLRVDSIVSLQEPQFQQDAHVPLGGIPKEEVDHQEFSRMPTQDDDHDEMGIIFSPQFVDHNTLMLERSVFRLTLCLDSEETDDGSYQGLKKKNLAEANLVCDQTCTAVALSAILFNLAISLHLCGLSVEPSRIHANSKSCGDYLRRALATYNLAARVALEVSSSSSIVDDPEKTTPTPSLFTTSILMALYNNEAHANFQVCDFAAAALSLQYVEALLCEHPNGSWPTGQQQEDARRHAYSLNVMFAGQGRRTMPAFSPAA